MTTEELEKILSIGGKTNSLGKVDEVIGNALRDKTLLEPLYKCMFSEDAWVRMRAADAFEKVCREHPAWIEPYIDRMQHDLSDNTQPSIQWHLAQIYAEVKLSPEQQRFALRWLADLLASKDIDWIVSANAMKSLVYFTKQGGYSKADILPLLKIQLGHKSDAVVKKAKAFIADLS